MSETRFIYVGEVKEEPDALAPDGIPIHLVLCDFHTSAQQSAMGPMRFLGVAEGRIPPGQWGVHAHCSLEQVTYVLEGEVVVQMREPGRAEPQSVTLSRGQAVVTLPTQTLSFANAGSETARVLFLCAPPYPADDSDTLGLMRPDAPNLPPDALGAGVRVADPVRLAEMHRDLTREELEHAIEQQERMQREVARVFEERIALLREWAAQRQREAG
jgi:mannose-6-phosphate isomerase-like protein (cupin superfamily)